MKFVWIGIGAVLLIVVIVVGINFAKGLFKTTTQLEPVSPEEKKAMQEIEAKPETAGLIDCGTEVLSEETIGNTPNFDCFIDASKNCQPAKLHMTTTINLMGMLMTSGASMEIRGLEAGKCIYYQKTESNSVDYSEEMLQQMLDKGLTQEQIEQQKQESNKQAQLAVGMEKTCKFNTADLTAMLNDWKQGKMSSEDYNVAECEDKIP